MSNHRVADYYDRSVDVEWSRMERHPFEFEITKRHLAGYLKPNDVIADIGGGPGRYAMHYAKRGHRVTLVDLSAANIAFAQQKSEASGITLEAAVTADARDLGVLGTGTYDAVLCMGPLYHLPDERDRAQAIGECLRIAGSGAMLAFAFITPTAHAISLAKREPEGMATAYDELIRVFDADGQPDGNAFGFTDAHYMHAERVEPYLSGFGLNVEIVAGAQTLGWAVERKFDQLSARARERWIDYCFAASTDRSLRGAAQHLLAICRKR